MIGVDPSGLSWEERGEQIAYRSSVGFLRMTCGRCGSPLPAGGQGMPVFVPTGLLEGDFGHRSEMQIFVASRAPWVEIDEGLTAYEAFPPGIDAEPCGTREPLDPPGGVRGSCLCGEVRFVLDGASRLARHCHCRRCQRARGAAHATNLIVDADRFRWTAGGDAVRTHRVPEARLFAQCFCGRCGSAVPVVDVERGFAVVPMGGLDDPPDVVPREHIWVDSRAPWHTIRDELPRYPERPPR